MTAVRRATLRLAAAVDRTFARTALTPSVRARGRSSAESLPHAERLRGLEVIRAFYDRPEHYDQGGGFFPEPAAIEPRLTEVRRLPGGRVVDLSWASEFTPLWCTETAIALSSDRGAELLRTRIDRGRSLADKYLGVTHNRVAQARWFQHADGPRPCVLVLHGYMTGAYVLEERLWPVRSLYDQGYDVVLSVLPFHAGRRDRSRGLRPPAFPSSDPRFTIEGFRQLVFDQRSLIRYLLDSRVASVGVLGMSLGGYSASLLATVEAALSFAGLVIPLAAIDRFAQRHGRLAGAPDEQEAPALALHDAQRVVSPLARRPLVASERVVVVEGASDHVTGPAHARLLAEHFGADCLRFDGGHVLQLGLPGAMATVMERMGHWSRTHTAG